MAPHTTKVLSICAGVGGLDIGVRIAIPGARTVCLIERESYAAATLVGRMEDAALDEAAIWDDLTSFDGRPWRGRIHILTAGLPCQPYSIAGKQRGHADERAIWPEFIRVVGEVQPRVVFIENVPEFLRFFRPVGDELSALGYRIEEPLFVSASECGGTHERERLFILARHPGIGPLIPEAAPRRIERGVLEANGGVRTGARDHSGCVVGRGDMADTGRASDERRRVPGELGEAQGEEPGEALQRERDGDAAGDCGEVVADRLRDGCGTRRQDEALRYRFQSGGRLEHDYTDLALAPCGGFGIVRQSPERDGRSGGGQRDSGRPRKPRTRSTHQTMPTTGGGRQLQLTHQAGKWPTPKAAELHGEKYAPLTSRKHFEEGRQIALSQFVRDIWTEE